MSRKIILKYVGTGREYEKCSSKCILNQHTHPGDDYLVQCSWQDQIRMGRKYGHCMITANNQTKYYYYCYVLDNLKRLEIL